MMLSMTPARATSFMFTRSQPIPIFTAWLHHFFHEKSEVRVAELHGDKTMLPLESSAVFHLVPFPSGGGETNIHK